MSKKERIIKKSKNQKTTKNMNLINNSKGITLIALVITIIVLLILAGVTINLTLGENGIFKTAEQAGRNYTQAQEQELAGIANFENEINNIIGGSIPPEPEEPPIDKVEPKVGYYADIDGDGTPDGVIYADLAVSKSGQWTDSDGTYSYTAKTNTKDYYISQTNYEGPFGTKDVLTAIDGEGEDRFYVMSLEDFNSGTSYYWYYNAYGNMDDYSTTTSGNFGTGRANTVKMIAKWNSSDYGAQTQNDLWGIIQDEIYEKGDQKDEPTWFVPSRGEWGAFGDNLQITTSNYADYGLSDWCWSSSQYDTSRAWTAHFLYGYMNNGNVVNSAYVRLSATF